MRTVFQALGESAAMRSHAERARAAIEKKAAERPDDPRFHAALGLAYAYLGRKEEAIREGNRAVSLCPVSKDALARAVLCFLAGPDPRPCWRARERHR